MSRPRGLMLAAGLVTMSGCFTMPAPEPEGLPLESKLLGDWDCTSVEESSSDHAKLTVLKAADSEYAAEWKETGDVDRYRAYPVKLKEMAVLVVREVTDSGSQYWTLVLPSFESDGSLSLRVPARRILDMSDETEALRELRSKVDSPDVWQSFARCLPQR